MGFFSWKTQDTHRSICNRFSNKRPFTVYMVNPKTGKSYKESNYEGYGVFGGKDYYELLAELNGYKGGCVSTPRGYGINLAFPNPTDKRKRKAKRVVFPILVENLEKAKDYDGSAEAEYDETQGYFYD